MPNIITPSDYSQARSPLYLQFEATNAGEEIVTLTASIYIYAGDQVTDLPAQPQVQITKSAVAGNVLLDVSQLVRAYFAQGYASHNNPGASNYYVTQASGAGLWVKVSGNAVETDGSYAFTATTFFAMDGFTYYLNEINATHSETILTTPRTIQLLPGQKFNLPVRNNPQIKWALSDGGGFTTYQNAILPADETKNQVVYLPLGRPNINSIGDLALDVVAANDTYTLNVQRVSDSVSVGSVNVEIVCEPKYEGHYIAFINKWGVWDTMLFQKLSKESIDVMAEEHRRIIGSWGARDGELGTRAYSYNTREGLHARVNAIGQERITLNTDWLNEDGAYNEVMRQLLQSEVFLMDNEIPVMLETKQLDYKTGVNDRLVQYTLTFRYAFEAINRAQ